MDLYIYEQQLTIIIHTHTTPGKRLGSISYIEQHDDGVCARITLDIEIR